jgi:hypothetical protein
MHERRRENMPGWSDDGHMHGHDMWKIKLKQLLG